MKKEIEESCNKCDPIFVKDKIVCIFICVYIYICVCKGKGLKGYLLKLFTVITWGMRLEVRGYIWLYVCWVGYCAFISVLFEFFTSMYYFCNKNVF